MVIPPRSTLIGERMFPGMVTESGNLVVLAIHETTSTCRPAKSLDKGDLLLLQGTWDALETYVTPPEVLVVDTPELVRRQVAPMGREAMIALGIMAVMVLLLATGHRSGRRRRSARRRRDPAVRHPQRRRGLPVDQLDDGDPRRRDDAALDRDHRDRCGAAPRALPDPAGRRLRAAGAADGPVRADSRPRAGDLQHRHRAHHHSDLGGRGDRGWACRRSRC